MLGRPDRAQFDFRGNNASFGGTPGANVANLVFDVVPTLVGGGRRNRGAKQQGQQSRGRAGHGRVLQAGRRYGPYGI
jgi:hypothetical protein